MNIQEIDLQQVLNPSTVSFVEQYAIAIQQRLENLGQRIEDQLPASHDATSAALNERYSSTSQAWERFFWARVATHYTTNEQGIDEALLTAEQDVLGLSSILHPL